MYAAVHSAGLLLPPARDFRAFSPAQVCDPHCDTHCDTSTGSTVCISTVTRCTLSAQLYSQIYMGYSLTPYLHNTVESGTESITAVTLGNTRCPKVQHPACASPGIYFRVSFRDRGYTSTYDSSGRVACLGRT